MNTALDIDTPLAAPRSAAWSAHLAVLGAAIGAILILCARDAADMAWQWWNSSTYGHCLFILPLVGWLIWQRRAEVAQVEPRGWVPGLVAVAAAAFGWLLGEAAGIALIRHAMLVAMIQASVLAVLGPAALRALLFPVFYLIFLVPFGDEFVAPLQSLTAQMTMGLLAAAEVPAVIDGVFITTPTGWFEVAEACAGVKFLVAMVAYGALVANVCFKSWRRRALFMAFCVVAPILANGLRAFGTIYAAHLTSVETATGFDHIVYGWFFFALVMLIVMASAWRFFDRGVGDRWLASIPRAIGPERPAWTLGAATIGIVLLPLLWSGTVIAAGRQLLPVAVALPKVKGWAQVPKSGYPWQPRFDGADHRLFGRFRDGQGRTVDVGIALYGWQGRGREIIGYGQGAIDPATDWAWSADAPSPPGGKAQRLIAPGKLAREAVTFYVLGDRPTGKTATVKLRTLKARLLGGDQAAAVLIVSAEEPGARPAIDAFLAALSPVERTTDSLLTQARGR
ncbi:MAG: exosortase A [Sphingomonadaceae bacterium]